MLRYTLCSVVILQISGELLVQFESPHPALRAVTSEGAALIGEADERGAIAVGKIADLLLLDRNPLNDQAERRRVV